jgi:hypothetical protein
MTGLEIELVDLARTQSRALAIRPAREIAGFCAPAWVLRMKRQRAGGIIIHQESSDAARCVE